MAPERKIPKPIQHRTLAKRRRVSAKGDVEEATLSVLDMSLKDVKGTRVIQEEGRLRVVAQLSAHGFDRERRFERIPVTRLGPKDIDRKMLRQEIEGHRPAGVPTAFIPRKAKRTHTLRPEKGEDVDRGGTIFGSDDRYLFDDQSFPWRTTGKVSTVGKWGSGTTIGPRHVLTASHVINWTGGEDGGVAWVTFTPGYFDGGAPGARSLQPESFIGSKPLGR